MTFEGRLEEMRRMCPSFRCELFVVVRFVVFVVEGRSLEGTGEGLFFVCCNYIRFHEFIRLHLELLVFLFQ